MRVIYSLLLIFVLLSLAATGCRAAVWQYSVPMPQTKEQRAYLWIPQNCKHVRGLIVGLQNMLERSMFEDPTIRRAAAASDLAIVWIAPGDELGQHPPLNLSFNPPDRSVLALHQALSDLAVESGYSEIQDAPMIVVGHSAATPFVFGMGASDASRVIALLPYKGWFPGGVAQNIPILHVSAEFSEWGSTWGDQWHKDAVSVANLRGGSDNCLIGDFPDIGAGHFDWNADSAYVIAMFIRKAAQYRIPAGAPVALNPIDVKSGWLVDPKTLGTPLCKPVPYAQWLGDTKLAYWYFDKEMAETVNAYVERQLVKSPQMLDFVDKGEFASLAANGFADIHPQLEPDGVTFTVQAASLTQSPSATLYPGLTLGHPTAPVQFRVSSGALKQTGTNSFQVWLGRGGVTRQGPPWEPWVLAFQPGDTSYRPTDRPAHIWIDVINKQGKPQNITFDKISDQSIRTKSVELHATSDSGLPVQYFVISGPVELDGGKLTLQQIPPRSKFPVRVIVGAFQWGRGLDPMVQSAGPVMREFYIKR